VADALARRWKLPRFARKAKADVARGAFGAVPVAVVKPRTFMNESGNALAPFLSDAFVPAADLLIMADDFALPLGQFRLRARGSAGGHNGLESVEQALGSREYARLRVGVGPLPPEIGDWADFVLAPWGPGEREVLVDLMPTLVEAVECWVTEGIEAAMNRFNRIGRERE